jgi:hypothetical protein
VVKWQRVGIVGIDGISLWKEALALIVELNGMLLN